MVRKSRVTSTSIDCICDTTVLGYFAYCALGAAFAVSEEWKPSLLSLFSKNGFSRTSDRSFFQQGITAGVAFHPRF